MYTLEYVFTITRNIQLIPWHVTLVIQNLYKGRTILFQVLFNEKNKSHVMEKEVLRLVSFLYQKETWLAPE